MKNRDMPAMPQPLAADSAGGFATTSEYCHEIGLTKREYFAGLAMQGLCTAQTEIGKWMSFSEGAAKKAVQHADALLRELEK